MPQKLQNILLVVVYGVFIAATFVLSGKVTERKTLYDNYIVQLEGVTITTQNREKSIGFYTDVLDLQPIRPKVGSKQRIVGFELPESRRLYLSETLSNPSTITLRVKNNLTDFHKALTERINKPPIPLKDADPDTEAQGLEPGTMSAVTVRPWGEEFMLKDYDGNVLVFYKAKRFTSSRY